MHRKITLAIVLTGLFVAMGNLRITAQDVATEQGLPTPAVATATTVATEANATAETIAAERTVPESFFAFSENGVFKIKLLRLQTPQQALQGAVQVHLVSANGAVRAASVSDDDTASFNNTAPGAYGIVVAGPGIYATVAVFVTDKKQKVGNAESFQMPVIQVRDDMQIRNLASHIPYQQPHHAYEDYEGFESYQTHPGNFHRAQLNADGVLQGRVYAFTNPNSDLDYQRTEVVILKDGRQVAQVTPSKSGDFEVNGLTPGNYGISASSALGYAAFGIEVTAFPTRGTTASQSSENAYSTRLVSMQQSPSRPLGALLLPRSAVPAVEQTILNRLNGANGPGAPGAGGTAGTGTGGGPGSGGGSGSGGGGIGGAGLAGIAGMAALGAAAASGSDSGNVIVDTEEATEATVTPTQLP